MEHDPVCGVMIRPGLEAANVNYQGQTFHFCSVECRDLFRENPSHYAKLASSSKGEEAKA